MKYLFIIILSFVTISTYAQKGAFGEDIKTEEEKIEEKIDKVTGEKKTQRPANVNSTDKSGENRPIPNKGGRKPTISPITKTYSVLLFKSENPIDITHKAMKLYGTKLFYRQIPNGEYFYMVGEFKSAAEVKKFFDSVQPHFPKAEIVNDLEHPNIK